MGSDGIGIGSDGIEMGSGCNSLGIGMRLVWGRDGIGMGWEEAEMHPKPKNPAATPAPNPNSPPGRLGGAFAITFVMELISRPHIGIYARAFKVRLKANVVASDGL